MTTDPSSCHQPRRGPKTIPQKGHGLPGCEPSQGSTLFVPFGRAGSTPGAAAFELPVLCLRAEPAKPNDLTPILRRFSAITDRR
jgi:hypothetical protein